MLVRNDEILLLRRFNTGYEDGRYSVGTGHLDGGEGVLDAMCREAREEAGIELDRALTSVCGAMHQPSPDSERIDFFLTAMRWTGDVPVMFGTLNRRNATNCAGCRWIDCRPT